MMWLVWLWSWPTLMPLLGNQAAYVDFAEQLRALDPKYRSSLRQVAHHDPRILWYSDVRYPRLIDQIEMLEAEGGKRNLEWERRQYGEKMAQVLAGDKLALLVMSPNHYCDFECDAPEALAAQGKRMPKVYLWLQARVGRLDRRYVLCGNQPPPWPAPKLQIKEKERRRIEEAHQRAAELRASLEKGAGATSTSSPAP